MKDTKKVIEEAYAAFNNRDIDGALALMAEDVRWPKASEGGTVVGKEEIRAYWTRQWSEFDPRVDPLAMTEEEGGKKFTASDADTLGTEAQRNAEAIAGQVSQAAGQLGLKLED